MTSVAYSNKGQRLAFTVQSAMATVNTTSPKDVKSEGEIKIGPAQSQGVVPDVVFVNADETEKPVVFKEATSDAVTVSTLIRQAAAAGGEPFSVSAFRSGGYTVAAANADTTLASYASTTSYTLAESSTDAAGEFRSITLVDGRIIPVLFSADGAAGAITPLYALPAAAQKDAVVKKTFTITPGQPGPVPDDKFLSFFYANRANPSDRCVKVTGAFLASLGDIVVEPGKLPKLDMTFGAADVSESVTTVLMTTANDFSDAVPVKVCDNTLVYMAAYDPAGSITASYQKCLKATIKTGKKAEIIPGLGDSTCLNNMQGAMGVNEPCEVTLEMLWDADKITDWEGTNADKMIAIIQPSTAATVPAWAFVVPKAHIMERFETDLGGNMIKMTIKYTANIPGMGSVTTVDAQVNQPWYFGIADRSA